MFERRKHQKVKKKVSMYRRENKHYLAEAKFHIDTELIV